MVAVMENAPFLINAHVHLDGMVQHVIQVGVSVNRKKSQQKLYHTFQKKLLSSFSFYVQAICSQGCVQSQGQCVEPDVCLCFDGWTGEACNESSTTTLTTTSTTISTTTSTTTSTLASTTTPTQDGKCDKGNWQVQNLVFFVKDNTILVDNQCIFTNHICL